MQLVVLYCGTILTKTRQNVIQVGPPSQAATHHLQLVEPTQSTSGYIFMIGPTVARNTSNIIANYRYVHLIVFVQF